MEKFIKGKWYKSKHNNYYKFNKIENGCYYFSEQIYNKIWGEEGGREWVGVVFLGLLDDESTLEEIQEYLPENHPDKIIENKKEDMNYLITLFKKLNII